RNARRSTRCHTTDLSRHRLSVCPCCSRKHSFLTQNHRAPSSFQEARARGGVPRKTRRMRSSLSFFVHPPCCETSCLSCLICAVHEPRGICTPKATGESPSPCESQFIECRCIQGVLVLANVMQSPPWIGGTFRGRKAAVPIR